MSRVCLLSLAVLLMCARAYADPECKPAGIDDDENAATELIGELGSPFHVRCLAKEPKDSTLFVFWYRGRGKAQLLYNDSVFGLRRNVLLIRSLNTETLGPYTCQVFNGQNMKAPRIRVVRAYMPIGLLCGGPWLVPRSTEAPRLQPLTSVTTTTTIPKATLFTDESEVVAFEGGTATLRCLFDVPWLLDNPPPKITWKFGERIINGTAGRYRLMSDGALEIVSVYRNDTGVYICVADNGLEVATQQRHLVVNEREFPGWVVPQITVAPKTQLLVNVGAVAATTTTSTKVTVQFAETSITAGLTGTKKETTESSETSERSTTYEGPTDATGPTTLDPCTGFQFGCCADNETEASGRDGQGCPGNATEFGCCSDGISPDSDLSKEVCSGLCRTSPHGCCQDNKTPAHGPNFEGCCLLQAFGCCPDNRKPAKGPHLEECGCQYTLHGCCPDYFTVAQGPDNQGCGCEYTQHGCCPDRYTAAAGPNNEGCSCKTYQFGCCADGVTIAVGSEQQGCYCYQFKFGCCGDGETHATGPDAAGCDCSSSQHGCCPNGRTEAVGPKFLGCTDAPENKQAACSMSTDPGPCYNFTAMWYYDVVYGGCSRFWYGGCDGNGNRFGTKKECKDVCVQPSPHDACKLPSVKGACDANFQRWHYDNKQEQCTLFRYGGCLGNDNNFDTRELCEKQCGPSSDAGQCNLPIARGSCAGNYSRWGFNSDAYRCEHFIWGGCEGNSNRFSSEAACQMCCAGTQPPQCTQPQEAGNCSEKEALWSFSQSENRCLPFYYSGCGGNDNRFRSRETCEQTCPSAYVPDKCTLPAATGQCSNYRERWFYDTTFKRCRQFPYGGCGGNENNFGTEAECENSCSEINTTTTSLRPTEPQPQLRPKELEQKSTTPERSELVVPAKCIDYIFFANCAVIVRAKFCRHKYYSQFCCKSCVEAGQLDSKKAELQAN